MSDKRNFDVLKGGIDPDPIDDDTDYSTDASGIFLKDIPPAAIDAVIVAAAAVRQDPAIYAAAIARLQAKGFLDAAGNLTKKGAATGLVELDLVAGNFSGDGE